MKKGKTNTRYGINKTKVSLPCSEIPFYVCTDVGHADSRSRFSNHPRSRSVVVEEQKKLSEGLDIFQVLPVFNCIRFTGCQWKFQNFFCIISSACWCFDTIFEYGTVVDSVMKLCRPKIIEAWSLLIFIFPLWAIAISLSKLVSVHTLLWNSHVNHTK